MSFKKITEPHCWFCGKTFKKEGVLHLQIAKFQPPDCKGEALVLYYDCTRCRKRKEKDGRDKK